MSQLQAAERAQPSYTRDPSLRATPVPPRRSRPGAQLQEVRGEASRVPREAKARPRAAGEPHSPLRRLHAPLGSQSTAASLNQPRWTPATSTCGEEGVAEVTVTAGVQGSGHLSCLSVLPLGHLQCSGELPLHSLGPVPYGC